MSRKALIIVDVQNDFSSKSGALSVSGAEDIYAPIERLVKFAKENDWLIVLTKDNHPENHCSFKINGGIWPEHCVQNTWGNEFSPELQAILLNNDVEYRVIEKGENPDLEEYSGANANMVKFLDDNNVIEALVCGLATDFCVIATAEELAKNSFFVEIAVDACKHVLDENLSDFMLRVIDSDIILTSSKKIVEF
jgi:nicotinamidase/pyrazinamidase